MKLLVFKATWGMSGPLAAQVEQIAEAGYDGVEIGLTFDQPDAADVRALVERSGLRLNVIMQLPTTDRLEPSLKRMAEYEPVRIVVHPGKDSMTRDEGLRYFEEALRVEEIIGLPVAHETHRGRLFFTPWDTAFYLRAFDTLRIAADYSHWVNVCERLPDDQADALELANRRAIHVHGRVGYEEGPQVPDPSAPEYAPQLAWHERQWQAIWRRHADAGAELFTFTPEYGPAAYMHTLPHTRAPVADLWSVCLWQANRARQLLHD